MALEIAVLIDACRRAALNTYCLQVVSFPFCPSLYRPFLSRYLIWPGIRYFQEFPLITENWLNISSFFLETLTHKYGFDWHDRSWKKRLCSFLSVAKHSPAKKNQTQMDDGKITSFFSYSNLASIWFLFVPISILAGSAIDTLERDVCTTHVNCTC